MVNIWNSERSIAAFCNDLNKDFIKCDFILPYMQLKYFIAHSTAFYGISCLNRSLLTKYPPSLIIEKVWLFSLYNDHVKEIPPVLANYELHAFVPKKDRGILTVKCNRSSGICAI